MVSSDFCDSFCACCYERKCPNVTDSRIQHNDYSYEDEDEFDDDPDIGDESWEDFWEHEDFD